jgi:threonyl-tRNA synthetase
MGGGQDPLRGYFLRAPALPSARGGKKIRVGEEDWIPCLVVFGEKERASGTLSVRVREDGSRRELRGEELASLVREKTREMPFRPLPLPVRLSRRPIFVG